MLDFQSIGFTCGAYDFISLIRDYDINGKMLLNCVTENSNKILFCDVSGNIF